MKAQVLVKERVFEVQQREIPVASKGQVVVRIRRVGICGSDVHYWAHGKCGAFKVDGPIVLGHESSGEVVALGEGVNSLKVGDRVALEPGVPCKECFHCRTGKYNLCAAVAFHATPPFDGTLAEYIVHPADYCFALPTSVSLEEGALIEPLSVGVHACDRAQVGIGSSVLITGAGPIGLVCVLACKSAGATTIIVSDINKDRLKVASTLGATHTIDATAADFGDQVRSFTLGMGADITMDASGAEPAIKAGMLATRAGGKYVSIGRGAKDLLALPFFEIMDREIDLLGVFRYRNTYAKTVALLASKRINVMPLITHTFQLDNALEAFKTAEVGAGGAIKVMLHI